MDTFLQESTHRDMTSRGINSQRHELSRNNTNETGQKEITDLQKPKSDLICYGKKQQKHQMPAKQIENRDYKDAHLINYATYHNIIDNAAAREPIIIYMLLTQ